MVFVVILCHVVLKTSHLSTSYPGSVRNQCDWRGLPTAGLHFILIRSPCLEDNHSVRTSLPGPLVYRPRKQKVVILRASDKAARRTSTSVLLRRYCLFAGHRTLRPFRAFLSLPLCPLCPLRPLR